MEQTIKKVLKDVPYTLITHNNNNFQKQKQNILLISYKYHSLIEYHSFINILNTFFAPQDILQPELICLHKKM